MTMPHISVDLHDETAYPAIWSFLPILCPDFRIGGLASMLEAINEGFIQATILGAAHTNCDGHTRTEKIFASFLPQFTVYRSFNASTTHSQKPMLSILPRIQGLEPRATLGILPCAF